jgi:hypothetical protein
VPYVSFSSRYSLSSNVSIGWCLDFGPARKELYFTPFFSWYTCKLRNADYVHTNDVKVVRGRYEKPYEPCRETGHLLYKSVERYALPRIFFF